MVCYFVFFDLQTDEVFRLFNFRLHWIARTSAQMLQQKHRDILLSVAADVQRLGARAEYTFAVKPPRNGGGPRQPPTSSWNDSSTFTP